MKSFLIASLLSLPIPFIVAAGSDAPAAKSPFSHNTSANVLVDGAVNPELISDYRAYSLLFRFISNRVGRERNAIRAYIRQIFNDGSCPDCPGRSTKAERQIDGLIAAGEEFSKEVEPRDVRIKELSEQLLTDETDNDKRRILREKELICNTIIDSLTTRLGLDGVDRLRSHIEGMKRKIRILQ